MTVTFDDSRVWLMWLNLFSTEAHDNFVFRVGLTLMDLDHNPFEEYSIPPYLRESFKRVEQVNGPDVVANTSSLEKKASEAVT
ncbi:hypothetical protein KCU81_g2854, partial [Aureobasidium melanogenum]